MVQTDKSGDQALYGPNVDRHEIVDGQVQVPASAKDLIHELHAYTGKAMGM